MSDSLSLLGKAFLEEGNVVRRRVIFNLGGSFFGENEDNMGEIQKRASLPRTQTSHFA